MIIGAELSAEDASASPGGVLTISRILHMNPSTPKNLDIFLGAYRRVGRYVMVPAVFTDVSKPPRLLMEHWVMQSNLVVRPAWQVGENDREMVGLCLRTTPSSPTPLQTRRSMPRSSEFAMPRRAYQDRFGYVVG
jgi:hypothetical protein